MAGSSFKAPLKHSPVSNQGPYAYRSGMGMVPSAEFDVFHDDFHNFVVATSITNGPVANTPWGWAGAIIDTGATVAVLGTATVGANGVLAIADATASEGAAVYGTKSIQLITSKKFFMEARISTNDVTDNYFYIGLSDLTAVTNPEDIWTTTAANFITFGLGDGDSNPKMFCDKSNSGSSQQIQTVKGMQVDTWHILGLYWDGGFVHGYLDGQRVITWASATSTTVPTATALAPFFGALNGNGAGGSTNYIDYFRYCSER